jgi:hypothetical protein
MVKNMKKMFFGILALMLISGIAMADGPATQAYERICTVLDNIGFLLYMIAGAIGIVVIVLQGIKWAGSAEDPGARKQAKQGIIHAIIGLIIVLLAVSIVRIVFVGDICELEQMDGIA